MRIQFDLSWRKENWKMAHNVNKNFAQMQMRGERGARRRAGSAKWAACFWGWGRLHLCAAAITQSMSRSIVAAIEQLSYANLHPLTTPFSPTSPGRGTTLQLADCTWHAKTHLSCFALAPAKFSLLSLPAGKGACQRLPAIFAQRLESKLESH